MKVVEATCKQILAYQISIFPVGVDQFPKYSAARITDCCLCTAILTKGLYMLKFHLSLSSVHSKSVLKELQVSDNRWK